MPSLNSPSALAANPPTFLRQQPTRIKNKCTVNLLIFATQIKKKKKRRKNAVEQTTPATYFMLSSRTVEASHGQVAEQRERYQKHSPDAFSLPALRTNTRFCFRPSRLLAPLCLIVCLFVSCSCSRTKAAASILPLSKNFPTCPLHCGCQPTNQRHAASRQRGFDANLQTSNNHYW